MRFGPVDGKGKTQGLGKRGLAAAAGTDNADQSFGKVQFETRQESAVDFLPIDAPHVVTSLLGTTIQGSVSVLPPARSKRQRLNGQDNLAKHPVYVLFAAVGRRSFLAP